MINGSTLVRTCDDVIGDIFTDEIQSREIVTDATCRERKTGSYLTHFHNPMIAEVRVVSHLVYY